MKTNLNLDEYADAVNSIIFFQDEDNLIRRGKIVQANITFGYTSAQPGLNVSYLVEQEHDGVEITLRPNRCFETFQAAVDDIINRSLECIEHAQKTERHF